MIGQQAVHPQPRPTYTAGSRMERNASEHHVGSSDLYRRCPTLLIFLRGAQVFDENNENVINLDLS